MPNSALVSYVPSDRLAALAHGEPLSSRTHGAALFADISGFTPLTEQLTHMLGARRGIEELTRRINGVYDSLISAVEQQGGSVISFAGDAITCWFDTSQGVAAARAVAAAQNMQAAMVAFDNMALKVVVTSGTARRFAVGDPDVQRLDTVAGATVERLSMGEHAAQPGEILADTPTVAELSEALRIIEWRAAESGERFAVVQALALTPQMQAQAPAVEVADETLKPWLLPAVYEREQSEHGVFLTELRPVVALFLRFAGIDYDGDEHAQDKLDAVIRRAQQIVTGVEGTLLQLTIGDKGSYFYAAFGAPVAHENDAQRAVQTALEFRHLADELAYLQPVQIGLSSGTMRTGAYGGSTRRTYGALGDEVNLAARLMTTAQPGEILASGRVQKAVAESFTFEPRPPLTMKGKAEPLPVFAVTGIRRQRAIRLEEPHYALPMIGRQPELALIEEKLRLALQSQGQVIGITAEAGMGKSRLIAEVVRAAHRLGFTGFGGACESSGMNTAYLVWKSIWQAFFDVDAQMPPRRLLHRVEDEVEDRAPARRDAIPLLAPLLDVALEDNAFTRTLAPKDRRNALTALLEDCLRSAAAESPLLLVLEDLHWIDPLSHDLLETLARASARLPVCFVLAYRRTESPRLPSARVESLPYFTHVTLDLLTSAETEQLIRAKLAQWFPEHSGGLPQALMTRISARAEGNPFFVEELLNYLRDRDISPYDEAAMNALELPNSLHALILSRVDQLIESQRVTLKTASIIGRLFQVAWLHGYYPLLGEIERVKADLDDLARADLTPQEAPEPELTYLFKHIVTQEVAYESLSYATRAQLHEQLARFIESLGTDRYLDLLAYHYSRSENTARQREYFRKAGDAAKAAYANEAALNYYERLLPLLESVSEQSELHLKRGEILELIGRWTEAEAEYRAALAGSQSADDIPATARCQQALGALLSLRGEYAAAQDWLEGARAAFTQLEDRRSLAQTLNVMGYNAHRQGNFPVARAHLEAALALAREIGAQRTAAECQRRLGQLAGMQGDLSGAAARYEESLSLMRALGDKHGVAANLQHMGQVALLRGDSAAARSLFEEALALMREMGNKPSVADLLIFLGIAVQIQGDYALAQSTLESSVELMQEFATRTSLALVLTLLGDVALDRGDLQAAHDLFHEVWRDVLASPLKTPLLGVICSGLAVLAARADGQRAAQLAAAGRKRPGTTYPVFELVQVRASARAVAAARARLPDDAFDAAWLEGASLTLEEAVTLALEEPQR